MGRRADDENGERGSWLRMGEERAKRWHSDDEDGDAGRRDRSVGDEAVEVRVVECAFRCRRGYVLDVNALIDAKGWDIPEMRFAVSYVSMSCNSSMPSSPNDVT